jgi:ParB family chromosome partitioning protein
MTDFLDTFAELNAAFGAAEGVVVLPIDQVEEDPDQPREHFDETALEALTGSVRRKGVLQPIVVRPANEGGRYRIRFGARRYRAARRAGLTEIKALIRAGESSEADLLIEQVIENDQRADLTTAERAKTVARLLELGLSQADIARELDKPKDEVSMLAMVRAMPPVLQALAATLGHRTLYELYGAWRADAAQTEVWLRGRDPEAVTQAEARSLAARLKGASPGGRTEKPRAPASAPEAPAAKADGEEAAASAGAGLAAPNGVPVLEVSLRGRVGELLLDRAPPSEAEAWVRFSPAGRPARVALADLTLIRIGPGGDRRRTGRGAA